VRWLLPLLAVFALLGQAVSAYAAAGVFGEANCCCPVKRTCKCHHDDKSQAPPMMKRCVGGVKIVAPAPLPVEPTIAIEVAATPQVAIVTLPVVQPIPDDIASEPETPPF
jgi:hypothetical protein